MVVSALFFAAMSAAVKAAALTLPNTLVVFFRNAVSLAVFLPWLARRGPAALATERLREHLIRGLFGLAAMYCFFFAIAHLRLADAVLLNYTLPLFLPAVERLWLAEPIPRRLWWPLGIGFAGILVILKPGSSLFAGAALVALASAILAAVAQVGIRNLTRTEPTPRIVFYFALIATMVSALPLPWTWERPSPAAWAALIASGLAATVGQLLLTQAYASAPAAQVGPFLYLSVVFSGILDWIFWRTLPDGLFLVGAALVTAAAMVALRRRRGPVPAGWNPAVRPAADPATEARRAEP
jgi:drug/metabolite transporter (DMT)-like permease